MGLDKPMHKKSGLGKGLEALLPTLEKEDGGPYFLCPLEAIRPNPFQPRKNFNQQDLAGLAESIRAQGIIQPLIVRKAAGNAAGFELIAGERRWRASQLVEGLKEVPVVIKDVSSAEVLELALIENIQRQDLNPLEEAAAYDRLIKELDLTQAAVAKRVGKNRSTVSNTLRLLQLPAFAKEDLLSGILSEGHARVLLSQGKNQAAMKSLRDEIVAANLSVRQAEDLAQKQRVTGRKARDGGHRAANLIPAATCREITQGLVSYLGCEARLVQNGGQGKLEIRYGSVAELERLLALIIKT